MLLLIITPRKFLDSNMDSGEIVYAVVEEVIGKTGKSLSSSARSARIGFSHKDAVILSLSTLRFQAILLVWHFYFSLASQKC